MSINPIPPSIGRVVLVRSSAWEGDAPGIINRVHSNECIDVHVMPATEAALTRSSVQYAEDHDASGSSISFHWMDYQLKVAEERNPNTGEAAATSPVRDDGRYARQRSVEYGIEAWKAMPQKERESTSILQLAADFNTFIEGPPSPE